MDQLTFTREELGLLYRDLVFQNPLLERVEKQLRIIGWTEEEIRTAQLLLACRSNASLTEYAKSIENRIAVIH